jgi:hypothetical protein
MEGIVDPNITNLKVGGQNFPIESFMLMCSGKEHVGKLIGVIPTGGDKKYPHWPMIEVQWYYKKEDLDR